MSIPEDRKIKVKFLKSKIRDYIREEVREDISDSEEWDSDDEDQNYYPLLKIFLDPIGWEMCGYINDLESRLENGLRGWLSIWNEGRTNGCYIDNFICRYRNCGLVEIEYI